MVADIHEIRDLEGILENILTIVVRLAGVATFIMFVIGGFQYLTASGDPKKAQTARNTLTYALGGFILVILSWFFLLFIEEFTGVKVTEFKFPR